jgi:ABC-type multidrug transport system ATPase subunit
MINLSTVSFAYNDKYVFKNFSASFETRVISAVTGLNGSGKSTLLKLIAGLLIPEQGEINITGPVALCAPDVSPYLDLTIKENIQLVFNNSSQEKNILTFLKELKVTDPNVTLSGLSSGNRQKVSLAIALHTEAQLYLFDEPGTHLDDTSREIVYSRIKSLETSVIIATNDKNEVALAQKEISLG